MRPFAYCKHQLLAGTMNSRCPGVHDADVVLLLLLGQPLTR